MIHSVCKLGRYSIGTGDRFAHQAKAQLAACQIALEHGVEVIPVWNKSNREHTIIGSNPLATRAAADKAVDELGWKLPYFCDADHITFDTVGRFIEACDYYTIDVTDFIGAPVTQNELENFVHRHSELIGTICLPGFEDSLEITKKFMQQSACSYLTAVRYAGEVYRAIEKSKGKDSFITEISMDETDNPQSPAELLILLAAISDEEIPLQTIAPKFNGRFNKGVEYVGDIKQFAAEFALNIAAIEYAVQHFNLPDNLKLSVHSGSDKFSLYPVMHETLKRFNTGLHLKTAGTTWLEEVVGLADAGGEALELAKEIYANAFAHYEELCMPYASVIDIDFSKLPAPSDVGRWSSTQFTAALRHVQTDPSYNPNLRQLLHVGFKIAAQMGSRYLDLLDKNEAIIAKNVTENLFGRHISPVFLGS